MIILLGSLSAIFLLVLALLFFRLRSERLKFDSLQREHTDLIERFRPVVDVDAEKRRVLAELETEHARLQADITRIEADRKQAAQNLQEQNQRAEMEMKTFQVLLSVLFLLEPALTNNLLLNPIP